jgi:hypothetical protein
MAETSEEHEPPLEPIRWNRHTKIVQDHRNSKIDLARTNVERAKRGLPVPWYPMLGENESFLPDVL